MQKKQSWYSQYTLEYPNRDPDKISAYAVGWTSIALLGACVMFVDIPAGVLLIVLLGLILTGVMLGKNPTSFKIREVRKIPWILAAFALPYLSTLIFACLYWHNGGQFGVIMCIISALLVSILLFYIFYRWQRRGSTEESLRQIQEKQDEAFSSLSEKIERSAEDLKQKLHPDAKYAEMDKWATVPDSIALIKDLLIEEGYHSRKELEKMSWDTIRIKLQKRLKESNAEKRLANNAHFYRTIDIVAEAAKEFPEIPGNAILSELNLIASPGNNLQRAKKTRFQRRSEDPGKK